MKRRIVKPRIILLDCPLEYKKAESAANLELAKEEDFEAILRQEEDHIAKLCADILAFKVSSRTVKCRCARGPRCCCELSHPTALLFAPAHPS